MAFMKLSRATRGSNTGPTATEVTGPIHINMPPNYSRTHKWYDEDQPSGYSHSALSHKSLSRNLSRSKELGSHGER